MPTIVKTGGGYQAGFDEGYSSGYSKGWADGNSVNRFEDISQNFNGAKNGSPYGGFALQTVTLSEPKKCKGYAAIGGRHSAAIYAASYSIKLQYSDNGSDLTDGATCSGTRPAHGDFAVSNGNMSVNSKHKYWRAVCSGTDTEEYHMWAWAFFFYEQ